MKKLRLGDIFSGLIVVKVSDFARISSRLLIGQKRNILTITGSLAVEVIEPARLSFKQSESYKFVSRQAGAHRDTATYKAD